MGKAMNKMVIALALGSCVMSGAALAGDVAAGQAKAAVCAACHGMDGIAVIPGYPNLKGRVSNT